MSALELSCGICRSESEAALVNVDVVDTETSASFLGERKGLVGISNCSACVAVVTAIAAQTLERHLRELDFIASVVNCLRHILLHPTGGCTL